MSVLASLRSSGSSKRTMSVNSLPNEPSTTSPDEMSPPAQPKQRMLERLREKLRRHETIDAASMVVKVVKEASEANELLGPLKAASGVTAALLDALRAMKVNSATAVKRKEEIQEYLRTVETHLASIAVPPVAMKEACMEYTERLIALASTIHDIPRRSTLERFTANKSLADDLQGIYESVDNIYKSFMIRTQLQMHDLLNQVNMNVLLSTAKQEWIAQSSKKTH